MSDNLKRIEKFNSVAGFNKQVRTLDSPVVQSAISFVEEEFKELQEALTEGNLNKTLDALADLIVTAGGVMHRLGFNTNDVMNIVNTANESKYCYTEEDAKKSIRLYQDDERYTGVYYKLVDGVYVVMGIVKETGKEKILKGTNFRDPDAALNELIDDVHKVK